MIKAALFDLDGVVLDTETQYTKFWGAQFRRYYPNEPGLEQKIKGMTLTQIYDAYFAGRTEDQETITQALNEFERNMEYEYIPGFESFVAQIRHHNVRTALVTSSNKAKMQNVYEKLPSILRYFDKILTSEDYERSKPDPECYLKGAAAFGVEPRHSMGFEDSVNGLKAVRAAGLYTVGLATTNPADLVATLADRVINDFTEMSMADLDR